MVRPLTQPGAGCRRENAATVAHWQRVAVRAWSVILVFLWGCSAAAPAPVATPGPQCREPPAVEAPLRVPFGFYSVPREQFSRLADAGVTMVGPYYGPTPSVALLDDAKAMGLGVVYPVGADEVDAVGAQVDAVAGHDAVVAWYVLPEELRPWVPAEVEYLDTVRRAVHGSDARRRPLLSYQPNHADRARLVAISTAFDIVSRGLYAGYVGQGERRAWVRAGAETRDRCDFVAHLVLVGAGEHRSPVDVVVGDLGRVEPRPHGAVGLEGLVVEVGHRGKVGQVVAVSQRLFDLRRLGQLAIAGGELAKHSERPVPVGFARRPEVDLAGRSAGLVPVTCTHGDQEHQGERNRANTCHRGLPGPTL